jgi:DNA-directed RNA polymerase subunit RPC12/RpoP
MKQKTCSKCRKEKPVSEFSPAKLNRDGLDGRCKQCASRIRKAYQYVNSEKLEAQKFVHDAINKGEIIKPGKCERCGRDATGNNLHAHHRDYMFVYDIEWLCAACHRGMCKSGRTKYITIPNG